MQTAGWARLGMAVTVSLGCLGVQNLGAQTPSIDTIVDSIQWFGAASVRFTTGGKTIYVDPIEGTRTDRPADIVLITHTHQRHYMPEMVRKVLGPRTIVVVPDAVRASVAEDLGRTVIGMAPGTNGIVAGIPIEAVPAYTVGMDSHPRSEGFVGYIMTIDGTRVYHTGATEFVPELKLVKADLVILGFWEDWIMDTNAAAELARSLGARTVVPIHFKEGTDQTLKTLLGSSVRLVGKPSLEGR